MHRLDQTGRSSTGLVVSEDFVEECLDEFDEEGFYEERSVSFAGSDSNHSDCQQTEESKEKSPRCYKNSGA